MPENIPDFTKIVFSHSQYLKYVLVVTMFLAILALIRSSLAWQLHKKFGGYGRCKSLAKKTKTAIDGPLKLILQPMLLTAVTLLLGLTLLEPAIKANQLQDEYEPAQIGVWLDCTISMLAEDVKPSRITAAKMVIGNLISRLKQEGGKDKVEFGRFTDIAIPAIIIPTKDYDLLEYELRLTTAGYLKMFENHGTNVWDAITQGLNYFDYSNDQEKILIIISDGEQKAEAEYIDKTRQEAISKRFRDPYFGSVKIFLVGIGSATEQSLIPKEKDDNGNVIEFYAQTRDGPDKGKLEQTSPDPAYLQEMASLIGGKFVLAESRDELNQNISSILNKERKIIGTNTKLKFENISPWFIGATLVLLFLLPISGVR